MLIILDAYNLLKQKFSGSFITAAQREDFLKDLQKYSKKKSHSILVVFDGGESKWITKEKSGNLEVVFSGDYSADYVIKEELSKIMCPENALLVSSDRELCKYAWKKNIFSIDSIAFYKFIEDLKEKTKTDKKLINNLAREKVIKKKQKTNKTNEILDELMMSIAENIPIEKELVLEKNLHNLKNLFKTKRTSSKQEKKMKEIIKKL